MSNQPLAIVLAAGKGTRMNSNLPKVLHTALGKPLVTHVLDALRASGVAKALVVVGYEADQVRAALAARPDVEFVTQNPQLGTGHAVMLCRDHLRGHDGPVLVVAGDSPMLRPASVKKLLGEFERGRPACVLGTLHKAQPKGLGRVARDAEGRFLAIVEEKDATPEQKLITEVNMSTYVFDRAALLDVLEQLRPNNAQKEYYLTDCPGLLLRQGREVRALAALEPCEALSVNTPEELRAVEEELRRQGCRAAG